MITFNPQTAAISFFQDIKKQSRAVINMPGTPARYCSISFQKYKTEFRLADDRRNPRDAEVAAALTIAKRSAFTSAELTERLVEGDAVGVAAYWKADKQLTIDLFLGDEVFDRLLHMIQAGLAPSSIKMSIFGVDSYSYEHAPGTLNWTKSVSDKDESRYSRRHVEWVSIEYDDVAKPAVDPDDKLLSDEIAGQVKAEAEKAAQQEKIETISLFDLRLQWIKGGLNLIAGLMAVLILLTLYATFWR